MQNSDGSVDWIYCHFDGYPSHNGDILFNHYTDREKVIQLIDLGDISSLGKDIGEKHDFNKPPDGQVNAYGRDRGEKDTEYQTSESVEEFLDEADEEYTYLFDENDEWQCRSEREKLKSLTQQVIDSD